METDETVVCNSFDRISERLASVTKSTLETKFLVEEGGQELNSERLSEREKYERIWSVPAYRESSPGEGLIPDFLSIFRDSADRRVVNDYGCGSGRAGLALWRQGFDVLMTDFADNCLDEAVLEQLGDGLKFMRLDLAEMGDGIRDAEWGFCCDVLEHIPEELVNQVIRNMALRCENAYFNISGRPDGFGPQYLGLPLHLTVRDAGYWLQRLEQFWAAVELRQRTDTEFVFVCRGRHPSLGAESRTHSTAVTARVPAQICLATYYDERFKPLGERSVRTIKKYCDTQGIQLERPDVKVPDGMELWAKLEVVRELFTQGYDVVMWVDADAAFVRFDVDIRKELRAGCDMALVKHYVNGQEVPNTGVFVIRNTAWSRALLASLISLKPLYKAHSWGENAAFLRLMGYRHLLESAMGARLAEDELAHVQWLDARWNSIPETCESPAPVIQHYAGHSMVSRMLGLQYLEGKAESPLEVPSCQLLLGDELLAETADLLGWHAAEEYRWTAGKEATLRIRVQPGQNAIELEASSGFPEHCEAIVKLDSQPLGSMVFSGPTLKTFAFDVHADSSGWKVLRFTTQFVWRPCEHFGSEDGRQLGIAIRSVRIFRAAVTLGLTVVLARYEGMDPHTRLYSSWLYSAEGPLLVLREYDLKWEPPWNSHLLVTHEHFAQPELTLLRRAMEREIPVLLLADGVAEYRNTWEVPDRVPGQQYQPLTGHKIACLGPSQMELYEAWGNAGRCELIGYPMFDALASRKRPNVADPDTARVLAMTARNPYFTAEHHDRLLDGLRDVKRWLVENPSYNGRRVEVLWRLTAGLDGELGVVNHEQDFYAHPLEEVVDRVDAVISTPSTAMLTPMIMNVPTAILDYFSRPLYAQAGWRIGCFEDLTYALPEMLSAETERMRAQRIMLQEAVLCDGRAGERLRELMAAMRRSGADSQRTGQPLHLPERVIAGNFSGDAVEGGGEMGPLHYSTPDRVAMLHREVLFLSRAYDCHSLWLEANRVERMDAFRTDISDKSRAEFHLDRYRFASLYACGRHTLDVACGTGYGAFVLVREGGAQSVVGIDASREATDYAQRKYGQARIQFLEARGANIPLPSGSRELAVSFETLEHIEEEDKFLSEIERVLCKDGQLILSTPNDWGTGEVAPFHVRSYDYDALVRSVTRYFDIESVYAQNSGTPGRRENWGQRRGIVPTTTANRATAECFIVVARKRCRA